MLRVEEQNFIVHRTLAIEQLESFAEGNFPPILVDFPALTPCGASVYASMQNASRDIAKIITQNEHSDMVELHNQCPSLPTLGGLLLSYPIIYYSEDVSARLLDASLDIYSIHTNHSESRVIMQFSGPPQLLDLINPEIAKMLKVWESRVAQLPPSLLDEWQIYTGAESHTFTIQTETRRVPIITL